MVATLGLLVGGTVLLYAGAEAAVRGATRVVRAAGIPAFTLGALLFGIDLESVGATVVAAAGGHTTIAAGGAFGTILFLVTAAFGAALLVSRRPIASPPAVMVVAPAVAITGGALALYDRYVTRAEGVILLVVYASYIFLLLWEAYGPAASESDEGDAEAGDRALETLRTPEGDDAVETPGASEGGDAVEIPGAGDEPAGGQTRQHPERDRTAGTLPPLAAALGGVALLYIGANVLLAGSLRLLEGTVLSAGFVGAAIVGTLTSVDEIVLQVAPIRRGIPELATGNLFGTIAAFTSGVPGLAAVVRPLDVDSAASLAYLAVAFLYAVVALVFLLRGRAGRVLGAFVLSAYIAWLALAASV